MILKYRLCNKVVVDIALDLLSVKLVTEAWHCSEHVTSLSLPMIHKWFTCCRAASEGELLGKPDRFH